MTLRQGCFAIRKKLTRRQEGTLLVLSFVLPLALWAAVSYTPFLYHPDMRITDAGDSLLCAPGDRIDRSGFERENKAILENGGVPMRGVRANPAWLPAPPRCWRPATSPPATSSARPCSPSWTP